MLVADMLSGGGSSPPQQGHVSKRFHNPESKTWLEGETHTSPGTWLPEPGLSAAVLGAGARALGRALRAHAPPNQALPWPPAANINSLTVPLTPSCGFPPNSGRDPFPCDSC